MVDMTETTEPDIRMLADSIRPSDRPSVTKVTVRSEYANGCHGTLAEQAMLEMNTWECSERLAKMHTKYIIGEMLSKARRWYGTGDSPAQRVLAADMSKSMRFCDELALKLERSRRHLSDEYASVSNGRGADTLEVYAVCHPSKSLMVERELLTGYSDDAGAGGLRRLGDYRGIAVYEYSGEDGPGEDEFLVGCAQPDTDLPRAGISSSLKAETTVTNDGISTAVICRGTAMTDLMPSSDAYVRFEVKPNFIWA